jgi:hypothetical protein
MNASLAISARLLAAACLLPANPSLAGPRRAPDSGQATATVSISLSVAPRFRLAAIGLASSADGAGRKDTDSFCLAGNGDPALLPVMLLWPGKEEGAGERAVPLVPCGAPVAAPADPEALASAARGEALIVRPE